MIWTSCLASWMAPEEMAIKAVNKAASVVEKT